MKTTAILGPYWKRTSTTFLLLLLGVLGPHFLSAQLPSDLAAQMNTLKAELAQANQGPDSLNKLLNLLNFLQGQDQESTNGLNLRDSIPVYLPYAYPLIDQWGNSTYKGRFYFSIGIDQWKKQDFDASLVSFRQSWQFLKEGDRHKEKSEVLYNLGILHLWQSEYDSAVYYGEKGLQVAIQDSSIGRESSSLFFLGATYMARNDFNMALRCLTKSIELSKEAELNSNLANCYFELANLLADISHLSMAKSYNQMALELYIEEQQKHNLRSSEIGVMRCISLSAHLEKLGGDLQEAIRLQEAAYSWAEQHNLLSYSFIILLDLADFHFENETYLEAEKYYLKLPTLVTPLADHAFRANLLSGLIELRIKTGKASSTHEDVLELETIPDSALISHTSLQRKYRVLSLAYHHFDNYEAAYLALEKSHHISDSILQLKQKKEVALLLTQYETEKKEAQNRELTLVNGRQNRQRIILLILLVSIVGFSGFIFWISVQRKKTNRQLAQSKTVTESERDRAEKSEKLMEQFLANMSHEIRTPLNAISTSAYLLSDRMAGEKEHEYLDFIRFSTQNLEVIINDVLDLSKLEAGFIEIHPREFDLRHLIHRMGTGFRLEAEKKGLGFELSLDAAIPAVLIGDAGRISQVLSNLLNNAIKFTSAGHIGLSLTCQTSSPQSASLLIQVEDTGIGIPTAKQQQVFESYAQSDAGIASQYGGTGLGLPISKQLVELMGGKLELTSEEGQGTTLNLQLTLPIGEALSPKPSPSPKLSTDRLNLAPLRILLADDHGMNRQLLTDVLHSWHPNLVIQEATQGEEVLAMLEKQAFDLLLLDLQMPIMDGFETLSHIRQHTQERIAKLPTIALTAQSLNGEKEKCLALGFDAYVPKPIDPPQLFAAITQLTANVQKNSQPPPLEVIAPKRQKNLLAELAAGDEQVFENYVNLFLTSNDDLLSAIPSALEAGNTHKLRVNLHKLKTNAAYLGSFELEQRLAQLEEKVTLEQMDTKFPQELEVVLKAVKALKFQFKDQVA